MSRDVMRVDGVMERVWTQRGVELERRRRQEGERDVLVAVVALLGFVLACALLVAVVARGVELVRARLAASDGGNRQEQVWMVENWRAGRYGNELADWE